MSKFDETIREIKYDEEFIQQIRGLLFWLVEPNESRDRKALVILAEYAKKWAESKPKRLMPDLEKGFLDYCQGFIDAGADAQGPEMPKSFKITIGGKDEKANRRTV